MLAHSDGGRHSAENYLAAHAECNNYRWDYEAEEFQLIVKLGVWAANEIRHERDFGMELAARFARKEHRRVSRKKK